jgi:hypothetical protein
MPRRLAYLASEQRSIMDCLQRLNAEEGKTLARIPWTNPQVRKAVRMWYRERWMYLVGEYESVKRRPLTSGSPFNADHERSQHQQKENTHMGRRNRNFGTPIPSALGDNHVDAAIGTINTLCQRTVQALTEYTPTRDETIRMLLPQEMLDRALAAKELIEPDSLIMEYDTVAPDVSLNLDYRDDNYQKTGYYPPINEGGGLVLQAGHEKLLTFIEGVRTIHHQFEELKAVLRWLNRNATPGAIRYYFPTVLALCPDSPPVKDLQHVPSRYHQPAGIGDWMQSIKDASACFASTQMLPGSAVKRPREKMWLTFSGTIVKRGDIAAFTTDNITYNF